MIQNLLSRGGILQRTLLTVMTPLLAVVISLGFYFTSAYIEAVRNSMNAHGASIAKYLAAASELEIFTENIDALSEISASFLSEPGVVQIIIRNARGNVLHGASDNIQPGTEKSLTTFEAPVIRTGVTVTDYLEDSDYPSKQIDSEIIGTITVIMSDDIVVKKQQEILFNGTVITILGLLLSFLLAMFVARSVSRPILRLTETVEKLTKGDLESRVLEISRGELGVLEHGINQMASTLQGSREKLVNEIDEATTTLRATVNELERRNSELNHAKAEAEKAGTAKAEFLASMSHEIRTPLSAVVGYSRLLENMEQTEEQQEYTRTITQAASQLLAIIDDILNFTRLGSGKLEPNTSLFNLHERFESIVSIQAAAAYEKQLELVLLVHSDIPVQITSDANRIGQILTNLIANAIKFTDQGHVVIEVALNKSEGDLDMIEVSVSDTGIGMSSDEAVHVFQPFTQADASTSKKYGGTGLGLAISKQLVELIGGDIGATSEPGKGSRFWFTIPIEHYTTDAAQSALPLTGTRVLVYDQNTFSRRAIRNRLLGWGASVFTSAQWLEMMDMLAAARREDNHYGLLVLGLSVQEYGRRLVTEILDDVRQMVDIPILLLIGAEAQRLSSDNLGSDQVKLISKPPRSDRMLRAIHELLPTGPAAKQVSIPARAPDSSPTDERLAGLKVLVAEDNQFNQNLIGRLLVELGVFVTLADNGQLACTRAAEQLFDVIFMDIHMPEIGGIEASQGIREGINRNTPIIALSADVFACEEALDSEIIQACITKPVTGSKLAGILREWATPEADDKGAAGLPARQGGESLPNGMEQQLHAELTAQIASLRSACQADDHVSMHDHLHQLKGISDYFQQAEFRKGCDSLRQAVTDNDRPAMIAALDQLDTLIASRD